jgi:peroxiredoxin family protein
MNREEVGMSDLSALQEQMEQLRTELGEVKENQASDRMTMVVFSGSLDKALAAFIIAVGSVAMGMEAVMFFTFWGTPVLRDEKKCVGGKGFISRMFGWMLPKGPKQMKLSQMNMGGMGTNMLKYLMTKKNVASLEQMIEMAGEFGVKIKVCEMSMDLMGFKREEMIDYPGLEYGGVASFLADAKDSRVQLFL